MFQTHSVENKVEMKSKNRTKASRSPSLLVILVVVFV